MINISIKLEADFITKIEISGHAESNEKGKDLICCSVSTLTISLINGLSELIKADINYKVSEGFTSLVIKDRDELKKDTIDTLTKTFLLSVKGLYTEYPKFINLKITEE